MNEHKEILADCESSGFDNCHIADDDRGVSVDCSQCDAVVVNGIPLHETGCPNIPREYSR